MSKIKILDACCGSRMFWFDKMRVIQLSWTSDKKNNGVKYVISTMDIKRDCLRLGVPFEDVYPLQTTLF